ncbi:unnamed protein product [Darwinula stevensoni]|nr:unnamed protein product [Darwinula stevensoni]CAG0892597.1 unnamed protein product [Darwinula stevensoni]
MAEVAGTSTAGQVQARFVTKLQKYAIPDTLYSIPTKIDVDGLSSLINGILKEDHDVWKDVAYDFLIAGEFLRVSLGDQLEEKGISTEAVIEIEYVEKLPAPEPHKSLLHDDWVSAIHADKSPKW